MAFKKIIRYRIDSFMAKGGISIFTSLVIAFLVIFVVLATLRGLLAWGFPPESLASQHQLSFTGNAYITFLELTDPGNMAQDIYSSPAHKFFAVIAGLSGVIIFSALIAFITTAMDQKISELKRGHSKVIEDDHTLILGWNEQRIVEIIRELIMANESEDDACVVILSDMDKETMDDTLRLRLPNTQTTRIVTRCGNTASLINLDIVSAESCKSMIILAACDEMGSAKDKTMSDAKVMQTILALNTIKAHKDEAAIVAEIYSPTYRDIINKTFAENIVTVDTGDILAKLLVQTSRSVGLSVVYNEILSYDGCEMYFYQADWGDISFADLPYHFADGVPMGIRHADGSLSLNPPLDYQLTSDDEILILADDDSTIHYENQAVAQPEKLTLANRRSEQSIEKELILGWSNKVPTILQQYADYVQDGSQIDIMLLDPSDSIREEIQLANDTLEGMDIRLIEKDRLSMNDLTSLSPQNYDNIIVLAEAGRDMDAQKVDSENIATLLLLRHIFEQGKHDQNGTKLITEILDSMNYPLISQAGVKDVIISNRLVSMILAQISESRDIKLVYDDIFEEDGSEIYLKPAQLYFDDLPKVVSFASMIRIAQQRGEVCLGVKTNQLENDADHNFGIQLIPEKNTTFTLQPDDTLVVLSEDEF
ncbi:CASTOR/POLLUX-related putative ion channel [Persicirhabdus sediminis]|uniref:CASTOR/POLLUX/SYM8 ion channel conserved domain-containing protein n=1 Tax=Persicirhabdus sediminis TaxID=454144 RepID=A0A8J7SP58_9BACT|nr:hypothetical protein [Persicirhabdus sediminis]MBK1792123.1 hypothetical protein [Persicirhabdus sediminis]